MPLIFFLLVQTQYVGAATILSVHNFLLTPFLIISLWFKTKINVL